MTGHSGRMIPEKYKVPETKAEKSQEAAITSAGLQQTVRENSAPGKLPSGQARPNSKLKPQADEGALPKPPAGPSFVQEQFHYYSR